MYLWDEMLKLSESEQTTIFSNYKPPYSPEVRQAAAYFIEDTFGANLHLDSKKPDHIAQIKLIISELLRVLEMKANTETTFGQKDIHELIRRAAVNIRMYYHDQETAIILFEHIRHCLKLEYEFLQNRIPRVSPLTYHRELINPEDYKWNVFRRLEAHQLEIVQMYDQWQRFQGLGPDVPIMQQGSPVTTTAQMLETKLPEMIANLDSLDIEFEIKFQSYFAEFQVLLSAVTQKIQKWKEDGQKVYQGILTSPSAVELDDLRIHCEYCANRLWGLHELLKKMQELFANRPDFLTHSVHLHAERVNQFQRMVCERLVQLVGDSFIVLVQPSQITRTQTNTKSTLQLLVGEQIRSRQPIKVSCYLINEIQAMGLINNNFPRPQYASCCCKIENNETEFHVMENKAFCAHFRNTMLPTGIERLDKRQIPGISKVSDENNWFYYYSDFVVDNIQFKISDFSYPVKIITNGSQEADFWESAIWDVAAGRLGVESVSKRPCRVYWQNFGSAVSSWYLRTTGRGLTEEDKLTIATKLLGPNYGIQVQQDPSTKLSWTQFKKDPVPGHSFTLSKFIFGQWKLILDHLSCEKRGQQTRPGLWEQMAVIGFVSEVTSAQCLLGQQDGAFLLRFSFSAPGALTVDFVGNGGLYQSNRNTTDDLKCRSILNRISDLSNWKYFYPGNIPKSDFLQKYALPADTSVPALVQPYVPVGIVARLEPTNV